MKKASLPPLPSQTKALPSLFQTKNPENEDEDSIMSENEQKFWKNGEVQDYILQLVRKAYPSEDLPKWVNYNEFIDDMRLSVFHDIIDDLELGRDRFSSLALSFPLVASYIDSSSSEILNYNDENGEFVIPTKIVKLWEKIFML